MSQTIEITCNRCGIDIFNPSGENYEPICELKHICKKQNSYPVKEEKECLKNGKQKITGVN